MFSHYGQKIQLSGFGLSCLKYVLYEHCPPCSTHFSPGVAQLSLAVNTQSKAVQQCSRSQIKNSRNAIKEWRSADPKTKKKHFVASPSRLCSPVAKEHKSGSLLLSAFQVKSPKKLRSLAVWYTEQAETVLKSCSPITVFWESGTSEIPESPNRALQNSQVTS